MVRDMIPRMRITLSREEAELAVHLRGNDALLVALRNLMLSRIEGRAAVPEPTDPLACKSMVARDRELQWLMGRINYIHRSPAQAQVIGEQPTE
jgi:hypothetical protein